MFWNVSKSIDLTEWKVVCARFDRNTHLTTLQYICIWHRYGNLVLTEIWMIFLFKEGTPRCLLYSVKSHKRSVLDKDPECNSRCMIFHNVWYKFLIFETNNLIKPEKDKDNNKKQLEAFSTVMQLFWDRSFQPAGAKVDQWY